MSPLRSTLVLSAALVVIGGGSTALAQSWTRGIIPVTQHDFGNVARGSRAEYAFEVINRTDEPLHIAAVRSSCGCTNPIVPKDTLQPGERGSVVAVLNTVGFTGSKSATITVVFDRPYYAEMQLSVRGYIRSDVVLEPAEINFGEVRQGEPMERQILLSYAGRNDWQIKDVKVPDPHIRANITEQKRGNGLVQYQLSVELTPGLPIGDLIDQLVLTTDDRNLSSVLVPIRGRILSDLTVSPASVSFGALQASDRITKRLIVKGDEEFQILSAASNDSRIRFTIDSEKIAKLHFIEMHFDAAGGEPGRVDAAIKIETDLKGGRSVELTAGGDVLAE
jgi:hypothetical protein